MATSDSREAAQARAIYDLQHRFHFHPADKARQDMHAEVRDSCYQAALTLFVLLPEGREKALVMTKLEEAMFWANAAVARAPKD
jgi:hypothetical protein